MNGGPCHPEERGIFGSCKKITTFGITNCSNKGPFKSTLDELNNFAHSYGINVDRGFSWIVSAYFPDAEMV